MLLSRHHGFLERLGRRIAAGSHLVKQLPLQLAHCLHCPTAGPWQNRRIAFLAREAGGIV
jgi:hypothetical protein